MEVEFDPYAVSRVDALIMFGIVVDIVGNMLRFMQCVSVVTYHDIAC